MSQWRLRRVLRTWESVPRPRDAPNGHAPGVEPDKILLLGTGPAVGWGVTSHELALPGALARQTALLTHRGADVDLIARARMLVADSRDWARRRDVMKYHAIVVVLGVTDALQRTSVRRWRRSLTDLTAELLESSHPESVVLLVGVQDMRTIPVLSAWQGGRAQRRAAKLNRETERVAAAHARLRFVQLPPQQVETASLHRHRSPAQYERWGKAIASALAPALDGQHEQLRNVHAAAPAVSEQRRQDALRRLVLPPGGSDESLQRIVTLARTAFQADAALLTVLDDDKQWHLAMTGTDLTEVPRSESFCDVTIQEDGITIVPDTLLDERFRNNWLVQDGPKIRFYAGIPIEMPSGERIGALCIISSEPRTTEDLLDVPFFAELAHSVERRLWKFAPRRSSRQRTPQV